MMKELSSVESVSQRIHEKHLPINNGCEKKSQIKLSYWVEYLIALAAGLTFGMFGIHNGWFGPTYLLLMDETKELYITPQESAWVAGFLQIGSIPGPFIGSFIANRYGRQKAVLATTLPNLIAFILVACATNVKMLYLSRFFAGISTGMVFVAVPIYVSEIASPNKRGFLNILPGLLMPVCTIMEFVLIPMLSVQENAYIVIVFVCIQMIILYFLPETPQFYLLKNREDKAEKSLMFIRQRKDVTDELAKFKVTNNVEEISYIARVKSTFRNKAFFILVGTMVAQQFSGLCAISSYSPVIIEQAQDSLSLEFSLILIQLIMMLMTFCAGLIIESAGRRPLFLLSTSFTCFSCGMLACYFMLDEWNFSSLRSLSWVPLVGIIIFTLGCSFGILSIPYLFVSELFPFECRAAAGSIISILGSIFGLIVTLLYGYTSEAFGMAFVFWMFGFFNLCFIIFGWIWVPETQGKTLDQIQQDQNQNKTIKEQRNPVGYDNPSFTTFS